MADVKGNQTAVKAIDVAGKVERNDLIPITNEHRHGKPEDLFGMWLGSNINYVVMITGTCLISYGLGFWQAIAAILIGNILGALGQGLLSLTGPRSGSSGIMISRTSFGQLGAFLPTVVNTIMVFGWFMVNTVVATLGLEQIFLKLGAKDSLTLQIITLLIIIAGEVVLALYGHATILKVEKWLSYVLGIVFFVFFLFLLPKMNWHYAGAIPGGSSAGGTWLLGLSAIIAYGVSWANFASDYSRYLPANASRKKIIFSAGLGQFLSLALVEFIGVMFGVIAKLSLGGIAASPVDQVGKIVPTWFFFIFMLIVVIGCMATNVPNGYTTELSLLALRIPFNRLKSVAVLAVGGISMGIVFLVFGSFYTLFQNFLSWDAFWTCPWMAVIIVDFYLRKGNYNTIDLIKWKSGEYWYKSGLLWQGVFSFLIGIAGAFLFMNTALFVSPLSAKVLGGGDISDFVGFAVAAVAFYFTAKGNPTYSISRNMKSSVFPKDDSSLEAALESAAEV